MDGSIQPWFRLSTAPATVSATAFVIRAIGTGRC
jgi:hypothetical protein